MENFICMSAAVGLHAAVVDELFPKMKESWAALKADKDADQDAVCMLPSLHEKHAEIVTNGATILKSVLFECDWSLVFIFVLMGT
jgi:hypothetical protein